MDLSKSGVRDSVPTDEVDGVVRHRRHTGDECRHSQISLVESWTSDEVRTGVRTSLSQFRKVESTLTCFEVFTCYEVTCFVKVC